MEVCKTLGLGGVGKDRMMGPRGFEDGQFRKSADWGEKQGRGEWRYKKMPESQL
jgi:hypothetical protein